MKILNSTNYITEVANILEKEEEHNVLIYTKDGLKIVKPKVEIIEVPLSQPVRSVDFYIGDKKTYNLLNTMAILLPYNKAILIDGRRTTESVLIRLIHGMNESDNINRIIEETITEDEYEHRFSNRH